MRLIILAALAIAVTVAVAGLLIGYKLIAPERRSLTTTPKAWGLQFEEFSVRGTAGTLRGWLIPTTSARGREAPFLILVHGYGENRVSVYSSPRLRIDADIPCPFTMEPLVKSLARWANVILYDQRAHGESEGRLSTFGPGEGEDIHRIVDHLVEEEGAEKIALVGWSMGGAAAIFEAADDPRVDALVVDSSYAVASDPIENAARRMGYPIWLMTLGKWGARLLGVDLTKVRPIDQIGRIAQPILIIQGQRDPVVPVEQAQRLQATAPNAQLWILPDSGHCEAIARYTEEYVSRVGDVLRGALGLEGGIEKE